ncbi:MAG TPA: aminotransferase class IV [Streptosporangiaceae bacterium]|nr:aminotransferase class IV [Streptosporangiaceae bacterium]
MAEAVWLNGTLVPAGEARVSVLDHGLTTGDGVFEAAKVTGGVPFALTRHLARLRASAAGLGLPDPDLAQIRAGVAAVLAEAGRPDRARIRITVTAGESVLGSARPDSLASAGLTTIIALGQLAGTPASCDVALFPWPRNERGVLAGVKTTSYAENVRALAYARERGAAEAIFGNLAGNLCEGTGTNVFVVTGGRLVTPPLSAGCLAGVTRGLLVEWAGVAEEDRPLSSLAGAEEAFLTGTTRDVQPIRLVDGVPLSAVPGPLTRQAAEIFAKRSAECLDP